MKIRYQLFFFACALALAYGLGAAVTSKGAGTLSEFAPINSPLANHEPLPAPPPSMDATMSGAVVYMQGGLAVHMMIDRPTMISDVTTVTMRDVSTTDTARRSVVFHVVHTTIADCPLTLEK